MSSRPRHPSIFEPTTLALALGLAILGTIIGLELLTRVGITANTSIVAAITVIAASRIPIALCGRFRDLERQNLLQTVISAASFGGANGMLLPMGLLWLTGRADLAPIMLLGGLAGLVIDATLLYRLFDTTLFPATGLWPAGVATAECMIAGDTGGRRARLLGVGALTGTLGYLIGIPMDIVGISWIGNFWALSMFGGGLLVRGYSSPLFGVDVHALFLPHGVMIGAGLVALIQIGKHLRGSARTVDRGQRVGGALSGAFSAFSLAAGAMAILAGLASQMSPLQFIGFVLFAAVAALVSELLVGIAAMHSGWFPAFATALIFLLIGMALGFPPLPLTFLVGFAASTGPAFADMGYDLKAGWILRGRGRRPDLELAGRRQQYTAELVGFAVAFIVVYTVHGYYFDADLFPPWDRVAAATIAAGATPSLAGALITWAIPGALIQYLGGPDRQLGVLFATGLLIFNPVAGWTALAALAARFYLIRRYGEEIKNPMYILAGGFIAGSAITSFSSATLRLR